MRILMLALLAAVLSLGSTELSPQSATPNAAAVSRVHQLRDSALAGSRPARRSLDAQSLEAGSCQGLLCALDIPHMRVHLRLRRVSRRFDRWVLCSQDLGFSVADASTKPLASACPQADDQC